MADLEDAATLSPLSTPPESIFDQQDDEMAGHDNVSQAPKDDNSSSIAVRMEEEDVEADSVTVKASNGTSMTARPKPTPANTSRKRKAPTSIKLVATSKKAKNEEKKWRSPFVYTDPKTPLARSDLRAILLNSRAWDVLSEDEQKTVLGLLPEHTHTLTPGTKQPRPNVESLRNNDTFRFDSARYCESIAAGKHDPDWLQCAWTAHEKRNRGDFDSYRVKEFEKSWSTRISPEYHPKALRSERSERQEATQDASRDSEHPATPRTPASKDSEETSPSNSKGQSPKSPQPASSHSSSVERKIAKVDIAKEEPNGLSQPEPPRDTLGSNSSSEETIEDVVVVASDLT